jgi:hypothetical protein
MKIYGVMIRMLVLLKFATLLADVYLPLFIVKVPLV